MQDSKKCRNRYFLISNVTKNLLFLIINFLQVAKKKFIERSSCERIVLYDENTCDVTPDSYIDVLANKLLETNPLIVHLKGMW